MNQIIFLPRLSIFLIKGLYSNYNLYIFLLLLLTGQQLLAIGDIELFRIYGVNKKFLYHICEIKSQLFLIFSRRIFF